MFSNTKLVNNFCFLIFLFVLRLEMVISFYRFLSLKGLFAGDGSVPFIFCVLCLDSLGLKRNR